MRYDILLVVRIILLLGAALGSTIFVLDYLRTVNLKNPHARLVIVLNAAIAAIVWPALFRAMGFVLWEAWLYLTIVSFVIVDICLWYQLVLLGRARKLDKLDELQ